MATLQEILDKIEQFDVKNERDAVWNLLTDEVLQTYNDFRLYVMKAQLCNEKKDSETAYKYAQEAIRLAPENTNGYFQRGIAFFNARQFKNAIADFNVVLDSDKENQHVILQIAASWYNLTEYENAIKDYTKVIELDSNNALAFYERGLVKIALLAYESAIADFDKVVLIKSDYFQAYCDMGLAYFMLGNYNEALINYNKCLEKKETYSKAYYNRGLLYQVEKKYTDAIADYTSAITTDQQSGVSYITCNAYNNRGNIHMINGEYDQAIADFNSALSLNPSLGEAYLNRGMIFQQELRYVDARGDFATAVRLFEPHKEQNKVYLNFLEEQLKLIDEKISDAEKLAKIIAREEDKKEFENIEKELDKLIDRISKAAKSRVKAVVHYTKLFVADIYLKANSSKMNYSNAIYMNDPNEGRILLNFMADKEIEAAYDRGEKVSELSVYLGSFLPDDDGEIETGHNDELVMWRTYGRDGEGNEACGCSIVIDSKFFKSPISMDKQVTGETADMLCKVIYIKDRGEKHMLLDDKGSTIDTSIDEFKNQLLNLIKIKSGYDPQHEFPIMVDELIYKKYSRIAYLFKSADYEYEHEVRVIKYVPRKSDTIKCYPVENKGKPGKLYVESVNPVFPFVQKIYLGPKVQDSTHWSLYLDYQVKQRQNEYKQNKIPEYVLNPAGITIVKSGRRFV